jgi:hypothetical protein
MALDGLYVPQNAEWLAALFEISSHGSATPCEKWASDWRNSQSSQEHNTSSRANGCLGLAAAALGCHDLAYPQPHICRNKTRTMALADKVRVTWGDVYG